MKKALILTTLALAVIAAKAQHPVYLDDTKPIEQRVEDALQRMTLDEKIAVIHAQSKFSSPGVKRLGFPDFWTDDGPHGVRPDVLWDEWEQAGQSNDSCVAFPALTCLAATWNPSLARLYGENLGEEALYRNKAMILGPGVNILRTPLGGRNFEYMGEDPYLASRMVAPYIQGLQSKGVAACVKHYAMNNDEEYRHQVNVILSDRALHEIYLPAFKAAVTEGHVWGLMGAYNLYQDQHNCHNEKLLNQILKGDWQYDGVVVSDWGGAHDTEQAIRYGLDMEFGTWTNGLSAGTKNAYDNYYLAYPYKQLIKEGKFTEKELNDKVRRVLRLFFRTTMNRNRPHGFLCSESHYEAARRIASEGIVLLKNSPVGKKVQGREGTKLLPLTPEKLQALYNSRTSVPSHPRTLEKPSILVVGENAIKPMTVGGGSSSLKVQREISPLDGLKKALGMLEVNHTNEAPSGAVGGASTLDYARGYVGDTTSFYNGVQMHVDLREFRPADELIAEAVEKARKADVVIFFGGLNKSDYQDAEGHDRKEYGLPYGQNELMEALLKVNPNIVYVNISGTPVQLPWVDRVPAIVQGWYVGSEAGTVIADVLLGNTNPSGKLPYTWYANLDDCGAHALKTYPGTWRKDAQNGDVIDEEYKEDIFVGYRWTDLPAKAKRAFLSPHSSLLSPQKPTFAFGHGLSYTTFRLGKERVDQSLLEVASLEGNQNSSPSGRLGGVSFTVSVTNTGDVAGAEVVQLYISDLKSSLPRPVKELKGFQKVFLQPGETRDVTITIDRDALSFYDDTRQQWVCEPGDFEALIGTASDRITSRVKFTLK